MRIRVPVYEVEKKAKQANDVVRQKDRETSEPQSRRGGKPALVLSRPRTLRQPARQPTRRSLVKMQWVRHQDHDQTAEPEVNDSSNNARQ